MPFPNPWTSHDATRRLHYGVEAFYNYAVTPWRRLTGDVQLARPSTVGLDNTVITGLRMQILF